MKAVNPGELTTRKDEKQERQTAVGNEGLILISPAAIAVFATYQAQLVEFIVRMIELLPGFFII
jgi:hypothetical protein